VELWTLHSKLNALDRRADAFVASINSEWLSTAMRAITYLGSSYVTIPLVFGIAFFFYRRRALWAVAALLITFSAGEALVQILKLAFHRARPDGIEVNAIGASFPSGHSFTSVVAYGFIAYLLWSKGIRPLWLWMAGFAFIILAVGFSRIYLHAHYFTDVIGGYIMGLAWLAAAIALARLLRKDKTKGAQK
jgi:undecaprenyl-diphosphatase